MMLNKENFLHRSCPSKRIRIEIHYSMYREFYPKEKKWRDPQHLFCVCCAFLFLNLLFENGTLNIVYTKISSAADQLLDRNLLFMRYKHCL